MGNLLIYSAAEIFCIWQRVVPRSGPYRGLRGRKPFRRGLCASSSVMPPAAAPTLAPALHSAN
jgi:hypothetical protein